MEAPLPTKEVLDIFQTALLPKKGQSSSRAELLLAVL